MTRLSPLVILLAWLVAGAAAADVWEINTDRDAFTPATCPVAAGSIVTEVSYTFIDNRRTPATDSYPELLVRLGATERLEWRLGFNYERGSGGSVVTAIEGGEGIEGDELATESTVLYGCKALVSEQDGWVPRSSAIIEAFTPLSGDVWGTEPAVTYAFGWAGEGGWRFDTAARYVLAAGREGHFNKWTPSVVLRMPITLRWEVHAEWFGTWSDGLEDNTVRPFIGPGTHLMLTQNLEIGCRMGWGLTDDAAEYYVDSGIGWRF